MLKMTGDLLGCFCLTFWIDFGDSLIWNSSCVPAEFHSPLNTAEVQSFCSIVFCLFVVLTKERKRERER